MSNILDIQEVVPANLCGKMESMVVPEDLEPWVVTHSAPSPLGSNIVTFVFVLISFRVFILQILRTPHITWDCGRYKCTLHDCPCCRYRLFA